MRNKNKFLVMFAVLLLANFWISNAQAQTVSSPSATKGEIALENKGNYHWNGGSGDDGWKNTTELEYGLTDWVKVAVSAEIEDQESDDLAYEATELEATFELTNGMDSYVDVGIKTAYAFSATGGPDEAELKLILRKDYLEWTHKVNFIVKREVGENSADGVKTGVAWGTYYDMGRFDLGGEYYGDFGSTENDDSYSEQKHRIGPVIGFDIPVGPHEIETKLGYLQGISKAADDSTFKYQFEIEF